MNIKRFINQNSGLIWRIGSIIIFGFFIIKMLNLYYEKVEENKQAQMVQEEENQTPQEIIQKQDKIKNNAIKNTMDSFVSCCNNRHLTKAYDMLTEDCKKAMFPTIEDFENIYINDIYSIKRIYDMERWITKDNRVTFLVTLYADMLSTGIIDDQTQEYYTFVKSDDGSYKININNFIYTRHRNLPTTINNITVKIETIDIYEEYEEAKITITNNRNKTICLTGNKYRSNIYLENTKKLTYSSLNSEFETEEIVLEPNESRTFYVQFNKTYDTTNVANCLVLSDVILDYEEYLNSDDKINYLKRIMIRAGY